jgi:hypothetical protein
VRAVANRVKLGGKPTLTHHRRREAVKRVNAGEETRGERAMLRCQEMDDLEASNALNDILEGARCQGRQTPSFF